MGKCRIRGLLAVSALLQLFISCTKDYTGTAVPFSAFSAGFGQHGAVTKTAYEGSLTGDVERINWQEDDRILIWCDNESATDLEDHTRYSDYKVVSHSAYSPVVSRAFLMPSNGGNGMQWGSGEHTFYAMYPSPRTTGLDGASFEDGTMTFTVPANRSASPEADSDRHIWVSPPDMDHAPMLSRSARVASGTKEVNLTFVPQYTAYEFIVSKGMNESVTLSGFRLSAADVDAEDHENGFLTGSFCVPKDSYGDAAEVTVTGGGRNIAVDWSASPVVLDASMPAITVTVHAIPQAVSSLTIGFDCSLATVEDGVDKVVSTTCSLLLQTAEHVPLGFTPYKKYRIDHLYLPVLLATHLEDSILWNYSLTVMDNVSWRMSASLDGMGWPDPTEDPSAYTADNVAWWPGAHIMDAVEWSENQVTDPEIPVGDHFYWWEDTYIPDFVTWDRLDHIELSSDEEAVLWRYQKCCRTVTAYNEKGEHYSGATVIWSVSPASGVVSVSPYTGIVTAQGPGTAVITATVTPYEGLPMQVSYPVRVNYVTSITIGSDDGDTMAVGETNRVSPTQIVLHGSPGSVPDDALFWSSSDTGVLTLSAQTGRLFQGMTVTAVAPGTATVTAKVNPLYGEGTSSFTITVTND